MLVHLGLPYYSYCLDSPVFPTFDRAYKAVVANAATFRQHFGLDVSCRLVCGMVGPVKSVWNGENWETCVGGGNLVLQATEYKALISQDIASHNTQKCSC